MAIDPQLRLLARQVDPTVLGPRIRRRRLALRLTQEQVISPVATAAYLSHIEKGERRPNVEILAHIANRLDLELATLLMPEPGKKARARARAQPADAAQARRTADAAATWLRASSDTTAYQRMVKAAARWEQVSGDLDPAALGRRIRDTRLGLGLTQTQVAAPVASSGYLSRIETGDRQPSPELLEHIAGVLGTDADTLLMGPVPTSGTLGESVVPHDLRAARAAARATFEWLRTPMDSKAYERLVEAIADWEATRAKASQARPRRTPGV